MESYVGVPEYTALGDGDLGVQVLAIFRAFPWRLDAALVREGWATLRWHEGRPSRQFPVADDLGEPVTVYLDDETAEPVDQPSRQEPLE